MTASRVLLVTFTNHDNPMPYNFEAVDRNFHEYLSRAGSSQTNYAQLNIDNLKEFIHTQITEALIAQNNKHQVLVLEAEREARKKAIEEMIAILNDTKATTMPEILSDLEALKNQSL